MSHAIFSDVLFQIGAAGALLGAGVFPLFLKRYREASADASDAASDPGIEEEFVIEPVRALPKEPAPVEKPVSVAAAAKGAEHPAEEAPAAKPASKTSAAPKSLNTGDTLSGGISPAIVYLQNLKTQIEHFETEIHELRSQVSKFAVHHDEQFNALLKRMGEMQSELHHELHHQEPAKAPAAAPASRAIPAAAEKPKSAPVKLDAAIEKPKPAPKSDPAVVVKLDPAIEKPKPAPKSEPAAEKAKPAAKADPVVEKAKPAAKIEPAAEKPKVEPPAEKPKPAVEEQAVSFTTPEPRIELSPRPNLKSEPESEMSAPVKKSAEVEPTVPVSRRPPPAEEAGSLILNMPEKAEPVDEPAAGEPEADILRTDGGKGPVWPV